MASHMRVYLAAGLALIAALALVWVIVGNGGGSSETTTGNSTVAAANESGKEEGGGGSAGSASAGKGGTKESAEVEGGSGEGGGGGSAGSSAGGGGSAGEGGGGGSGSGKSGGSGKNGGGKGGKSGLGEGKSSSKHKKPHKAGTPTSGEPAAGGNTTAQFISEADKVCGESRAKMNREVQPYLQGEGGIKEFAKEAPAMAKEVLIPGLEAEIGGLRALSTPASASEVAAAVIGGLQGMVSEAKAEPVAFLLGAKAATKSEEVAKSNGFNSCGPLV